MSKKHNPTKNQMSVLRRLEAGDFLCAHFGCSMNGYVAFVDSNQRLPAYRDTVLHNITFISLREHGYIEEDSTYNSWEGDAPKDTTYFSNRDSGGQHVETVLYFRLAQAGKNKIIEDTRLI